MEAICYYVYYLERGMQVLLAHFMYMYVGLICFS